jgi:ATP-binding protein involved in chromosome partitioning
MSVSPELVLSALRNVMDPDLGRDIVTLGFVKDLRVEGAHVSYTIELTTPACPVKDDLKAQAEALTAQLPGVETVSVEMTAQVRGQQNTGPLIPGVAHVVAVASGKGGVGKSTVSCSLAAALAQTGARVGLVDADIYGPSIPLMMGTGTEKPRVVDQRILPVERHGIKLMSIGFFVEEDKAVVWRGPMIGKALNQFLGDVDWGELDYLVVDLPPGTGDAPMSLCQLIPISGVVVVTTPQDVARSIARKSVMMFRELERGLGRNMPILGVVENMSGFVCPCCGEETPLFLPGGGRRSAEELGVPFLGSVPLDPAVTLGGDCGVPAILTAPDSRQAESFREIAGRVASEISRRVHHA